MKRKYILLTMTVLFLLVLCGCRETETAPPVHLVIIAENCAARPAPDLSEAEILLTEVIESEGSVCVITADGNPCVVLEEDFTLDDRFRNASKEYMARQIEGKTMQVIDSISQLRAEAPEIDLYEAFRIAADYIRYKSKDGEAVKVLIFSSGVPTTGEILLGTDIYDDTLLNRLEDENLVLDLSPADEVIFYGLGETLYPQPALTASEKDALKSFWSSYIGISDSDFINPPVTEERKAGRESLPPVSVIDFSLCNASFDPFTIEFLPDSAVPADESDEAEKLQALATLMKDEDELFVMVCGSVAGDVFGENAQKLALDRANYVRQQLVAYDSLLEPRVITIGLSDSKTPYRHIFGARLNSKTSEYNRVAFVMDARSEEASALTSAITD